jgi:MFS transporter, OPA family, glycerol-3-phosphate transporter
MMSNIDATKLEWRESHKHPPGFRARRGINWFTVGLMYAMYYMCRYNFRFAAPGMREEFGFSITQISDIWVWFSVAYGTGQLVNGLFCDRIGGRASMLLGAVGTITVNLIFGFGSFAGNFATFSGLWLMNGYLQAAGTPGMVKINAAWFNREERGVFSGIFGFMIQSGQVAISKLAPVLLAGFTIGAFVVEPGRWRLLFIVPPIFVALGAVVLAILAAESPDDAGFPGAIHDDVDNSAGTRVPVKEAFKFVFSNPLVWFYAVAYGTTGAVRHSSDQLIALFFEDVMGFNMKTNLPGVAVNTLALIPLVAVAGSVLSGWVSDRFFRGHRYPVAMALYFVGAAVLAVASLTLALDIIGPTTGGILLGCLFLVLIAIMANSTHSIVGAAAPMDIGGKKMAGFASGVIDSFQYYGSALSLFITGRVLDATKETHGWNFWFIIMTGFALLGGFSMLALLLRQNGKRGASRVIIAIMATAVIATAVIGTSNYRRIVAENEVRAAEAAALEAAGEAEAPAQADESQLPPAVAEAPATDGPAPEAALPESPEN